MEAMDRKMSKDTNLSPEVEIVAIKFVLRLVDDAIFPVNRWLHQKMKELPNLLDMLSWIPASSLVDLGNACDIYYHVPWVVGLT